MTEATTTHNNKEIVKGASKGNSLPPLSNQFMTTGGNDLGASPLYVLYIEPIVGFDCKSEGDEE